MKPISALSLDSSADSGPSRPYDATCALLVPDWKDDGAPEGMFLALVERWARRNFDDSVYGVGLLAPEIEFYRSRVYRHVPRSERRGGKGGISMSLCALVRFRLPDGWSGPGTSNPSLIKEATIATAVTGLQLAALALGLHAFATGGVSRTESEMRADGLTFARGEEARMYAEAFEVLPKAMTASSGQSPQSSAPRPAKADCDLHSSGFVSSPIRFPDGTTMELVVPHGAPRSLHGK